VREPTYFILLALAEKPRHGYGVAKRVAELSDGRVHLAAGTLYGALDRLQKSGQIDTDREEVVEGRRRRYYRITEDGHHAVAEEANRMQKAGSLAEFILGPNPSSTS